MSENHLGEEELVLFYYGEAVDPASVDSHLSGCAECRAEYRALQQVLNTVEAAPTPARDPDYGAQVWKRIEKKLRFRRPFISWIPVWAWAPAAAALLLLAFWLGRVSQPPAATTTAAGNVRERILLVAVGDHLERSQMILAEISNAPDGHGKLDISDEQQTAEDLLDSNRLYRQTANATGDRAVAGVLDDLERVLLEIAHSPSQVDETQLNELRQQIRDRGLLFKIRVIGSRLEREQQNPQPASRAGKNGKSL